MLNGFATPLGQFAGELEECGGFRTLDGHYNHGSGFDASAASDSMPSSTAAEAPARAGSRAVEIGSDERRMHVRAYNYWCSLLDGRDFPSIQDLDSKDIEDFGPHSVIVDLTGKLNDPATPFVGQAIKDEIGVQEINSISDVPGRSLLSRLTDHHFQIIATRAPVGFEAEFVNQRGHEISYRGILMPFSSDGDVIDFVYGVINWKDKGEANEAQKTIVPALPRLTAEREDEQEVLDKLYAEEAAQQASQERRQKAMLLTRAPGEEVAPDDNPEEAWAIQALADMGVTLDPEAGTEAPLELDDPAPVELDDDAGLADRLWAARESAEVCKQADGRSRAALYRALAMAYDFSVAAKRVPEDYAEILDDAGVKAQARAPMTPIVKLVFGADYDKTRLTEFAAALSFAEREAVDFGGFADFVEQAEGGLKGLVAAERKARRPAGDPAVDKVEEGRAALRRAPGIDLRQLATNEEFAIVLTRRNADGVHEAVQLVADSALLERLLRRAAD